MSESESKPDPLPEGAPDDPITGHQYDGIQEYDNPLPGWWKWAFIATIVMSPLYFMFFHGGAEGRSIIDQYDRAAAENLRLQFKEIGELNQDRETVLKYLYEPKWLRVGQSVFKTNCKSCHGSDGGGLVGPNLCDDEYKNVKDIGDILTVIQNGANGAAMPAWKTRLSPNELVLTASYVASLRVRDARPATPKAPEGRAIPAWPPAPPKEAAEEAVDEPSAETQDQ